MSDTKFCLDEFKRELSESKAKYLSDEKLVVIETTPTKEVMNRFLNYRLNFGRHKGCTWRQVYYTDRRYFGWAVISAREHSPSTHEVLSHLLDDQDKVNFDRISSALTHKPNKN